MLLRVFLLFHKRHRCIRLSSDLCFLSHTDLFSIHLHNLLQTLPRHLNPLIHHRLRQCQRHPPPFSLHRLPFLLPHPIPTTTTLTAAILSPIPIPPRRVRIRSLRAVSRAHTRARRVCGGAIAAVRLGGLRVRLHVRVGFYVGEHALHQLREGRRFAGPQDGERVGADQRGPVGRVRGEGVREGCLDSVWVGRDVSLDLDVALGLGAAEGVC